jgi:hypothetical protein
VLCLGWGVQEEGKNHPPLTKDR